MHALHFNNYRNKYILEIIKNAVILNTICIVASRSKNNNYQVILINFNRM